jgi:RecA/RadA recombinase
MVSGGFPKGKIVGLAGDKATGKTYILINAFKNYLDSTPDGKIILFESEGAISKEMLEKRGLDTDRIVVIPVNTIEEFRNQIMNILNFLEVDTEEGEYPNVFVALDSLGMLSTEFEINDAVSGDNKSDMGRRAKLIKSTFRAITLKLSILQIPMVFTNHTYASMSAYSGKAMGGGTGLEYAASIIIFLSKSKVKDNKSKIKNISGNNITFRLEKGRLTIEGSKITVDLDFNKGINKFSGILTPLIECGIFTKKGAWISKDGDNIAQGDKKFYDNVEEIITDSLLEEIAPVIDNIFVYGE